MEAERRCEKCGQMIPWGELSCPACGNDDRFLWSLSRNELLLASLAALIVLFIALGGDLIDGTDLLYVLRVPNVGEGVL